MPDKDIIIEFGYNFFVYFTYVRHKKYSFAKVAREITKYISNLKDKISKTQIKNQTCCLPSFDISGLTNNSSFTFDLWF